MSQVKSNDLRVKGCPCLWSERRRLSSHQRPLTRNSITAVLTRGLVCSSGRSNLSVCLALQVMVRTQIVDLNAGVST